MCISHVEIMSRRRESRRAVTRLVKKCKASKFVLEWFWGAPKRWPTILAMPGRAKLTIFHVFSDVFETAPRGVAPLRKSPQAAATRASWSALGLPRRAFRRLQDALGPPRAAPNAIKSIKIRARSQFFAFFCLASIFASIFTSICS